MNKLLNILRLTPPPEKITTLDDEANLLLVEKLIKPGEGFILSGHAGKVTAMRLIDEAAKQKFGTTVTDVPLTQKELQTLLDEGLLDLSETHLKQVYEANRGGQREKGF